MKLTKAQTEALGYAAKSYRARALTTCPRITSMRALERRGLVTIDTWPTYGNLSGDKGVAWNATITDEGMSVLITLR